MFVDLPACVTLLSSGARWTPAGLIETLRDRGQQRLAENIGPRYAGMAAAMFLGIREELQPEDMRAFVDTATIHLLVVSGMNVGVLTAGLLLVMRMGWLPRLPAIVVVAAVTVAYALVTDAQPPVVRAAVMTVVFCGARVTGRRALDYNTLAAAAIAVLVLNPADLFSVGPQLSFLAVLVLAWFSRARRDLPPPEPLDVLIAQTRPWPERFGAYAARELWRSLLLSGSDLLGNWPAHRGTISSGFASGGGVGAGARAAGGAGDGQRFRDHGRGIVDVAGGEIFWRDLRDQFGRDATHRGIGPGLARRTFLGARPERVVAVRFLWRAGLLGWLAALAAAASLVCGSGLRLGGAGHRGRSRGAMGGCAGQPELVCTVLSVGHGSAVVLELPDGRALLYDGGCLGSHETASRAVANFFWSRGRTHLDAVVLSHADADHYNALPALLQQFSVGAVYVSPVMFENLTGGLRALQDALRRARANVMEISGGDRLRGGDHCQIEVLHPPRRGVLGSDNANSIVLAVECDGRRLLLTGDLESPGLDDVLAEAPLECDVLLAPHHGSVYSAAPRVAAWCKPKATIISGSPRDQSPAVQAAYGARGRVWHTARVGAVEAVMTAGDVRVHGWRAASAGE